MPIKNVEDAMHEFKSKNLHSGKGGPLVKSRKQAIAIGLSKERESKGKKGRKSGRGKTFAALKGLVKSRGK